MIDMHAAHERVNYNLIREQYRAKQVPSQRLLIPVTVELPVIGVDNVLTHDDLLSSFGIEIEPFGEAALIVRAMPAVANRANVETLIKEIALESLRDIAEGRIEECVDCICARLACHSSIRSGKVMKDAEVYALFAEMDRAEVAAACPHGRPVAVSFAAHEIESWFGRDR